MSKLSEKISIYIQLFFAVVIAGVYAIKPYMGANLFVRSNQEIRESSKRFQRKLDSTHFVRERVNFYVENGMFDSLKRHIDSFSTGEYRYLYLHTDNISYYNGMCDYRKVISLCNDMLLSSSSFKQVPLELRGEAYLKLNKLDSAIADFRQAYELDTFYTHYAKALGEAYNVIGQKDSAKKYMNIYTASQKQ